MHNNHNSSRYFLTESKNPHLAGGAVMGLCFKLVFSGGGAQHQVLPPPARRCPVKGGMSPCRSQGERNLLTAFFFLGTTIGGCEAIDGVQPSKPIVAESLAIRFSFLCLYWQKEKAD